MSQVNVINVIAHNAKAPFLTPLSFEIFFEALQPLRKSKKTSRLSLFNFEFYCSFGMENFVHRVSLRFRERSNIGRSRDG
jgi:hypothetical protein